jgi:hypothetical protein
MLSYSIRVVACITIVSGIFCLVWLRSNFRNVEYELGSLEREMGAVLKERKSLLAERASMLSIHAYGTKAGESMGLGFPDRQKVFYVKRDRGDIPYEASFRRER